MGYRKFRAGRLFTGSEMLENGEVLIADDAGKILDIVPGNEAGGDIETVKGLISPGFVNCHCHLELSHLKGVIPPGTGLIDFLCSVVTKRDFDENLIRDAIRNAEREMEAKGIVAVGDIGNKPDTLELKSQSSLLWHNFVEVLGFSDEKAAANLQHYSNILGKFEEQLNLPNRSSLVPHAPYSISPATFRLINEHTAGRIISIHNQENPAEDELFRTGKGPFLRLFALFGLQDSPFPVTGTSSIRYWLPFFNQGQKILLVHNTCSSADDIAFALDYAHDQHLELFFCVCINANLYIENKVPPISEMIKQGCRLVLGTDSYSSNWELSIAGEIASVLKHYPELSLKTVLSWATSEGAKAMNWDHMLGDFQPGKKPGIVRIEEDFSYSERLL